ncbi:hypothetical protein BH23ACT8_BH23ACT8_11810 [soil metagenome]
MIVRPLQPGDVGAVRALWRDTVVLGRPLPFALPDLDRYARLSLDWYLGPGATDAAVLERSGRVQGYALVCTDEQGWRRWAATTGVSFALGTAVRLLMGRYERPASRFHRLRLTDGWDGLLRTTGLPAAHAHVNLAPAGRRVGAGMRLARHVDERCAAHGIDRWWAEINARRGRRERAIERLGGTVVDRRPNRTLSWLVGEPIIRLIVVRDPTRIQPTATAIGASSLDA